MVSFLLSCVVLGVWYGIDGSYGRLQNNFEISHRSIWESELYTRFFKFLDEAGGE